MSKYPNSGSISKNQKKEKEKHPDYRGQANVDGHDYWVSAWIKEGKDGKFLSLAFQQKDGAPPPSSDRRKPAQTMYDDEIPF